MILIAGDLLAAEWPAASHQLAGLGAEWLARFR
jgi:hypothetical protein